MLDVVYVVEPQAPNYSAAQDDKACRRKNLEVAFKVLQEMIEIAKDDSDDVNNMRALSLDHVTRNNALPAWQTRAETLAKKYWKCFIDATSITEVQKSAYYGIMSDLVPKLIGHFGNINFFSTQSQESLNGEVKQILRNNVTWSGTAPRSVCVQVIGQLIQRRQIEINGSNMRSVRRNVRRKLPGKIAKMERKAEKKKNLDLLVETTTI